VSYSTESNFPQLLGAATPRRLIHGVGESELQGRGAQASGGALVLTTGRPGRCREPVQRERASLGQLTGPTSNGWNQQHFVPIFQGVVCSAQEANVFLVDVDV